MASLWDIADVCDTVLRELVDRCPPANKLRPAVDLAPLQVATWLRERGHENPTRLPYDSARRIVLEIPFPFLRDGGASVRTIGDLLSLINSMPSTRDSIDVRLNEAITESMKKREALPHAPMSDAVDNLRHDADKMRRLALDAIEIAETKENMLKKIDEVIRDIGIKLTKTSMTDPELESKLKSAKQTRTKVEIQRIQTRKEAHDKTFQAVNANNLASQVAEGRRLCEDKTSPVSACDAAKQSAEGGMSLLREYDTDTEGAISVHAHVYNMASYIRPLLEMYDDDGAMEKIKSRLFDFEHSCLKKAESSGASSPEQMQRCIASLHEIVTEAISTVRRRGASILLDDVLVSWQTMIVSLAQRIQEENPSALSVISTGEVQSHHRKEEDGFFGNDRFIDFDPSSISDVLNAKVARNLGDVVGRVRRMRHAHQTFTDYKRDKTQKQQHRPTKMKRRFAFGCAQKSH